MAVSHWLTSFGIAEHDSSSNSFRFGIDVPHIRDNGARFIKVFGIAVPILRDGRARQRHIYRCLIDKKYIESRFLRLNQSRLSAASERQNSQSHEPRCGSIYLSSVEVT